jgi:hypothetical protein
MANYNTAAGYGGGLAGAGLAQLFSNWKNPADAAMPELNKIPNYLNSAYQPYIDAGNKSLGNLQSQYGNMVSNPGDILNNIGSGFQKSPGFDFALQQALQASNNAQAAGGMAGSPQHEQLNMGIATNLGNQEYNDWISKALGIYGQGTQGEQELSNQGYNASNELVQSLVNSMLQKAGLQYQGQNAENQHEGGALGAFGGGLGALGALAAFG